MNSENESLNDLVYEVGKPYFSIVDNGSDEHPDKDVIRISDCTFDTFIDVSHAEGRDESLKIAAALCKILNYPFEETSELDKIIREDWLSMFASQANLIKKITEWNKDERLDKV
ncbi:MAG: hypothetical protein V4509_01795 [Patescibacteria group bacterium]